MYTLYVYMPHAYRNGDVVLTFGSSPLMRRVFETVIQDRHQKMKSDAKNYGPLKIIVVDSRPLNDGLLTMSHLQSLICEQELHDSVEFVYTTLAGAASSFVQYHVTKVFLGASALLGNGSMLAPAGSAMVALLAKSRRVPVIVACETFKFSEKVYVDSIVYNELGNELEVVNINAGSSNSSSSSISSADLSSTSSSSVSSSSVSATPQRDGVYRGNSLFHPASSTSTSFAAAHHTINTNTTTNTTTQFNSNNDLQHLSSSSSSSSTSQFNNNNTTQNMTADAIESIPYHVVNLRYDFTSIDKISAVATDSGLIPPSSIPTLIRRIKSAQESRIISSK